MNYIEYASPFRHWAITETPLILRPTVADLPGDSWPFWVRYSSAWECGKRTCTNEAELPRPFRTALQHLASRAFVDHLRSVTGISDLIPAPYQHGGGVHVTDPGGRLDCHLDFAQHPAAPFLERRLSLIVFCNTVTGGTLQLFDDEAREPVAEVHPVSGTAVMFENSDISYHGVTEVLRSPRVTLAAYYCSPIRDGVRRKRALWVPVRK